MPCLWVEWKGITDGFYVRALPIAGVPSGWKFGSRTQECPEDSNFPESSWSQIWATRTQLRELEGFASGVHPEMCLCSIAQACRIEVRVRADTMEGERRQRPVFQMFKGVSLWRAGHSNTSAFWPYHEEKPGILTRGLLIFQTPQTLSYETEGSQRIRKFLHTISSVLPISDS